MHLIEILLPLADNDGAPFPAELFRELADELTERFGGLTAFTRAPAQGRWKGEGESVATDEIVILEVMSDDLDLVYWRTCRRTLEKRFRQDQVIIRVQQVHLI